MTGDQLRAFRESMMLTRDAFAEMLGDCSASTVNKWERDMHAIPKWVEEKCYRSSKFELPIEEMHQLLQIALAEQKDFQHILTEALQDYIAQRGKPEAPTVTPGPANSPNVLNALSSAPFKTATERSIAAEKGATYQAKKKTSSGGPRPA